jgi:predicted ATPase
MAEAPGHLYSLADARAQFACLHQLRREPADTQRWAALTIELGDKQGFAHRVAIGHVLHAWARGTLGETTQALAELESGLDATRQIGMELDRPYFLALLAEILAGDRQFDRALAKIEDAQRQATRSRSFFYEAELWRLRGSTVLAAHGSRAAREADDCFARAVETSTRQGARILFVRAELARAKTHGASSADRAKATLGVLYTTFAEGLDTPDLVEMARFLGGAPAASA